MDSDVAAAGRRLLYGAVVDRQTGPSVARIMLLRPDRAVRWKAAFPMAGGSGARLVVALGGTGTAFAAYRGVGGDIVLRRLDERGATTWRTTIQRWARLTDMTYADGGLYLLLGRDLVRFAA